MTTNISLLLLTKNESENIKNKLSWLRDCPNITQLVIVDDCSIDNTLSVIKSLNLPKTLKVCTFIRPLDNDFATQRTYGVEKCTNPWVLWLDADEIPDKSMINFLNSFKPSNQQPYSFKRIDFFYGQKLLHGENSHNHFIRLFSKNNGKFTGSVHEKWVDSYPIIHTNFTINHYPHPSLYSFLHKINFYTDIRARELFQQKIHTNILQIIFYPFAKFIYNYIFRLGFQDGMPGIIMALTMSFHSFLVRSKLWHLWQK